LIYSKYSVEYEYLTAKITYKRATKAGLSGNTSGLDRRTLKWADLFSYVGVHS